MQLSRRAIEGSLQQKGFVVDDDSHHRYFHHEYDGKRTGVFTYTSRTLKDYGDPLLSSMRKQLKLDTVRQLRDLVNCPMSQDEYNAHLKDKELLTTEPAADEKPRPTAKAKRRKGRRRR